MTKKKELKIREYLNKNEEIDLYFLEDMNKNKFTKLFMCNDLGVLLTNEEIEDCCGHDNFLVLYMIRDEGSGQWSLCRSEAIYADEFLTLQLLLNTAIEWCKEHCEPTEKGNGWKPPVMKVSYSFVKPKKKSIKGE